MSISTDEQLEKSRDRYIKRSVKVLDSIEGIDPRWVGWQRLIQVERSGTRSRQPFSETVFYISSLTLDAPGFAQLIRQHWQARKPTTLV